MLDPIHGMVNYMHKHSGKRWTGKCVGGIVSGCVGVFSKMIRHQSLILASEVLNSIISTHSRTDIFRITYEIR